MNKNWKRTIDGKIVAILQVLWVVRCWQEEWDLFSHWFTYVNKDNTS